MYPRLFADRLFWLALFGGVLFWFLYTLCFTTSGEDWSDQKLIRVFVLVFLFPLLEEATFRGLLQSWLLKFSTMQRNVTGLSIANLMSSIAFAAAHTIHQPLTLALAVFFPSLVFGFFRDRYHSIVPGYVIHSFYNAGFYLIVWLAHIKTH